jgi:hypothetical protein
MMPARAKLDFAAAGVVSVQGPASHTSAPEKLTALQRRWREIALGSMVVSAAGVIGFFVAPHLTRKADRIQPVAVPRPAAAVDGGIRDPEDPHIREVKENP